MQEDRSTGSTLMLFEVMQQLRLHDHLPGIIVQVEIVQWAFANLITEDCGTVVDLLRFARSSVPWRLAAQQPVSMLAVCWAGSGKVPQVGFALQENVVAWAPLRWSTCTALARHLAR